MSEMRLRSFSSPRPALCGQSSDPNGYWRETQKRHKKRAAFEMVCERPPAAFGGSPPHGACPSNANWTGDDRRTSCTEPMSKIFRDWSPEQHVMFPSSVMDLVPKGHLAHFIRNVVSEQLDLR